MSRVRQRPVLVFDGECGFCTASVVWILERLRRPLDTQPWQTADLSQWGLTEEEARRFAWWIGENGTKEPGHRAVARALLACRRPWPLAGRALLFPPLSWIAALGYRLVAANRGRLPGTTPACRRESGWPPEPATSESEASVNVRRE